MQGKNITVTPALRDYAAEKLARATRYFDHVKEAQVVLSVERRRGQVGRAQVVEATVSGDGVLLRAEEASADMYASIDLVADKLRKQIERYRSRFIDRRRLTESRRKTAALAAARRALRAGPRTPQIVRVKRFAMKPMTAEDAALQMELLGHDFFVFRNAKTLEVNVVYKRADGHYGVIEPER
ncbi:MAG: ribosome-associated translation inhibitor RaiA [Armatimonadota bacterium]|nr:ribosome-associated translation inhibitor RaiA [Armatimonadota bacterium]MDR7451273.1 ribosome-associated translation inhibitor RaiA [Armatimonadota bacterium]MDR7466824.1 ribosome-associated translation inhibitor RaiA [Armatimonadota bacterium]MDR7492703.1 ribosome-associated translation inhibitor RaiA [Armatimonadota bacterium]MDR7499632.1 ribosome-associated translation inhibitor RaiA [Armatimonadota bacterium]